MIADFSEYVLEKKRKQNLCPREDNGPVAYSPSTLGSSDFYLNRSSLVVNRSSTPVWCVLRLLQIRLTRSTSGESSSMSVRISSAQSPLELAALYLRELHHEVMLSWASHTCPSWLRLLRSPARGSAGATGLQAKFYRSVVVIPFPFCVSSCLSSEMPS